MANSVDDVYGSKAGVDFAKMMAEALSKQGTYTPSADMAKLPGSWMYGVPNIVSALAGNQYRDIMGSQDKVLSDRTMDPNAQSGAKSYGYPASQPAGPSAEYGTKTAAIPKQGDDQLNDGSVTGSLPSLTKTPGNIDDQFLDQVKLLESGGDPNLINQYGYKGHFQFSNSELKKYGVDNGKWRDPALMREAAKQRFADIKAEMTERLGRPPTQGEMYLGHQRGVDGAVKGIENPGELEWMNMLRTGEGKQRFAKNKQAAVDWAQRTVRDNVPKQDPVRKQLEKQFGDKWYLNLKSGDFQPMWTRRFRDKAAPPAAAVQPGAEPPLTGSSGTPGLTGSPESDTIDETEQGAQGPPGDNTQVAQAFPSTPTTVGPQGDIPPANPIESDAQLQARLRAADPADRAQIMENYLKRKEGREIETATGKRTITPTTPGQQPIVTQRETKTFPITIGSLHLQVTPDGKGGFNAVVPGGDTKNFKTLDEIWKWEQQGHARGEELNTRANAQGTRYEAVQAHAEQTYQGTKDRGRQLALATQLVNDPKFISGSFQQQRDMISKFLTTLNLAPPGSGSDITQAFVKLISGNILDDIKGLGGQGLGQLRDREMKIIQDMNAMPDMSPGAIRAVINLNNKANQRLDAQNEKALDYSAENGKIDAKFYQQMRKYYAENPLLTDQEITDYKKLFEGKSTEGKKTEVPGETKKRPVFNAQTGKWE